MRILVLGARGQLGQSFSRIVSESDIKENSYIFLSRETCDITDEWAVEWIFDIYSPDVVINCAAYTNVDKAERDFEKAFEINVLGVKYIAEQCKKHNTHFIHISTDYVFSDDVEKTAEDSPTKPCNTYGATKEMGERVIACCMKGIIL